VARPALASAAARRLEQHAHRTFASGADAEQNIVRAAHVVLDRARNSALQHLLRVKLEIRFEAAAAEQPQIAAVGHDEHACARLAVRRARRGHHGRKHAGNRSDGCALQEQFEARVEPHVGAAGPKLPGSNGPTRGRWFGHSDVHARHYSINR
jgi:hypothetical protein